jgi:hypothetical protein
MANQACLAGRPQNQRPSTLSSRAHCSRAHVTVRIVTPAPPHSVRSVLALHKAARSRLCMCRHESGWLCVPLCAATHAAVDSPAAGRVQVLDSACAQSQQLCTPAGSRSCLRQLLAQAHKSEAVLTGCARPSRRSAGSADHMQPRTCCPIARLFHVQLRRLCRGLAAVPSAAPG